MTTHPSVRTDQPTGRLAGARVGSRASPSQEGHDLAALGFRTRPRSLSNPAGSLGAEVRQVARVPGAAKSRRTESATQLCCGTREAGSAARIAEPCCPHARRLSPPPLAGRKRPRRGAEAPGQGAGGGRGASGAARRSPLPASRCGGRGVPAGVTAPPARPPPGSRRRAGSWRGQGRRRPRAWGRRVRTYRTGRERRRRFVAPPRSAARAQGESRGPQ